MAKTQLMIIGGFLGAGKTTAILSMAQYLKNHFQKVGIVTNDQSSQLVDTHYLKSEGWPVVEVTGGCFGANYDELIQKAENMAATEAPDVILAEAVGSCTDLIAALFRPIQAQRAPEFDLCPLCVVADPQRVRTLVVEPEHYLWPDEITYLFQKQLEEADFILLNRMDTLAEKEADFLAGFLRNRFPGASVIPVAANNIQSVGIMAPILMGSTPRRKKALEVDYDCYGAAGAMLGWLDMGLFLIAPEAMDWNEFVAVFMSQVRMAMTGLAAEIAHLKVYAVTVGDYMKASLTALDDAIRFDRKMGVPALQASLLVNARIRITPAILETVVEKILDQLCREWNIIMRKLRTESFRPGRPDPKQRLL